jgi:hypothetical protein
MAGLATHAVTCATEGKEATRTPKSGMSLVTDTLIHDNRDLDTSYGSCGVGTEICSLRLSID